MNARYFKRGMSGAGGGRRLAAPGALLLGAALAAPPAAAHHSRAMFDAARPVKLEGTVAKETWRNPHVYFEITVAGESGAVAGTWTLEGGSVAGMVQSGWVESTLGIGDVVSVEIAPHKDPQRRYASLISVTVADGTRYESFTPGAASRANAPSTERSADLSGTWNRVDATNRGGAVGNEAVAGPTHWPLTERGRRQAEAFATADDPMFRCVFYGVPRLAASVYSRRFSRSAERIVIEQEQYPLTRTIWLDGRPMPADFEPSALGFSSGRFEADGTLLVETTGFSYTPWGSSAGLDSSDRKLVVERYKLSSDGLKLDYSHTLVDPEFLTAPVVESFSYEKIGDREYVFETCDVDSARRPLQYAEPVR